MVKHHLSVISVAIAASLATGYATADEVPAVVLDDMETITVSSKRVDKPLKDVAGSVSVLSAQDIEKQVVTDMSQLFKYDPSVEVTGNAGQAQNIIVRGMGGDRILLIKDGMRMNEGYGANGLNDIVGRGFIDTDTVKQVEVAKGAASSLYGSDALGGIVVFTTKDASDYLAEGEDFGGKVKFGYNAISQQYTGGASLALRTGQFEHLLHLTKRQGEEQQNYYETEPALDIDSQSLLYKGKYHLNDTDYISFTADLWNQEVKGDYAYGLLEYFRDLAGYTVIEENSTSEQDNKSFQLRYFSETATPIYDVLSVSLYQNDTKQTDIEYGQLDINANFGFPVVEIRDMWKTSVYSQDTVGFLSNASLKINDSHTLGYGLDIENSASTRTEVKLYEVAGVAKPGYPQNTDKFPKTEVKRAGFFINDEISLLDGKLTVTPGARFDQYEMTANGALKADGSAYKDFDESNVSLNIGALYKFTDTIAAFAQYGQGFKVPAYDLAYLDHDNSIYGYRIVPSDDLSPEESDTFEIGVRGHQGDLFFSAAVYYSKYDNFLSTELVDIESSINPWTGQPSDVLVYQYRNIDAVTIKGIEASVRYHLNDELAVYANAAYNDGKDDTTGDYLSTLTPLSGVVGLSYALDSVTTDVVINWADDMKKTNEGEFAAAGYGTVDVMVSYDVNQDWRFNVAVNNLFDKTYIRQIGLNGHASDANLESLTEAGRTIAANVSYQF
ncbi:TonB-dependent hemoglobin/transferrin/lactoferrin family receptor [Thalassotalea sp. LPB0316]|uniref:TonB-dependent hemoglobin/transferrin/lactoferrin family receptor n=1 Tax=Thalassotalea sp. LPB0316 TaxID=2769490 RepID=UPI001866EA4F|nr:TonB-dependent hemoglobin/transferrin/lactoferrin family receptor [Thalassotalea sp. LPB0316]QOL25840.1 TonB-dependent hemoglobin/transferrin/lactoferrin family receptor [Thalassotalea sp. LPB0316]